MHFNLFIYMMLIAEALQQLQFQAFLATHTPNLLDGTNETLEEFQRFVDCQDNHRKMETLPRKAENISELVLFNDFIQQGSSENNQFKFWNTFLSDIVSVLIDLNRSFREGDWDLHLSFNKSHYRRWAPLYFEDCNTRLLCYSLETKFPKIYESFVRGAFVLHQTERRGSGISSWINFWQVCYIAFPKLDP